jgi:hypothetical protein
MDKKKIAGSAVPSVTDVHEREQQDRPLYATRVIGQEVWKPEVFLMATVSIGYTQRGKRVDLGLAMEMKHFFEACEILVNEMCPRDFRSKNVISSNTTVLSSM